MSEETKVNPEAVTKDQVVVPNTGQPLLKGHRDQVVALPLAKLKIGLENLEKDVQARFQTVAETSMKQLQWIWQQVQDMRKDLSLFDETHSGLLELLITKGLITREEFSKSVDTVLENKLNAQAVEDDKKNNRQVVDRAAKDGDFVWMDYKGTVGGKEFDGGSAVGSILQIGSKQFIPGFEGALVGKKAGDKFILRITAPENYPAHLANKELSFEITVRAIKETIPQAKQEA
jgi:FKBP-type peptidyl-prolyl cis-trans isomerase